MARKQQYRHRFRVWIVMVCMSMAMLALVSRAIYLHVVHSEYLQARGNARHLRVVQDHANRGMILDRNGVPLAISTPVDSIWAHPLTFIQAQKKWPSLARMLDIKMSTLRRQARKYKDREFMYIKRHVSPNMAKRVMALKIPGVNKQREYRRYYPAGVIAGHVVGFTNIDDRGQEGLELAYDDWLRALPGKKRVLKDRFGNIVETVESVSLSLAGKDLVVSIDRRIQYMTYRALKQAVEKHKALSATAVVVDVQTGEVLAMANYPGFNPNNRAYLRSSLFRNRAITDVFEPGSTMKPFIIAAAIESGRYTARSIINTAPGTLRIGRKTIRDHGNYGWLSLAHIIEKSSNVGAAKVALSMKRERLWKMFRTVGFGEKTGLQQPGESNGLLRPPEQWARLDQATISYGYGISVTAVQLARAYLVFANNGKALPLSLLPGDKTTQSIRVMSAATATTMRSMLERAVSDRGTGRAARIVDYRVAGKTGTTHKLVNGRYADNRYISVFAGMAPATRPRLVMVVKVEEPTQGGYYGGVIAAPIFSKVMTGSLRALNVLPDDLQRRRTVASKSSRHPG